MKILLKPNYHYIKKCGWITKKKESKKERDFRWILRTAESSYLSQFSSLCFSFFSRDNITDDVINTIIDNNKINAKFTRNDDYCEFVIAPLSITEENLTPHVQQFWDVASNPLLKEKILILILTRVLRWNLSVLIIKLSVSHL